MNTARTLSDRLASLLATEHGALADFLVALADFDRRRLWVELGHASLFYFLHRELGLSKGAAYHRKVAAELLQRFPEVEEPLRDGRLCITSVVELARVLTPENRAEVLPRFFHRSKKEARAVAAEIRPAEVVTKREVVTRVAVLPEAPSPVGLPHPRVGAAGPPAAPLVHPDEPAPRLDPSRSPPTCVARTLPCPADSSRSWRRHASGSPTLFPARRASRSWRWRWTSCCSARRAGRGSSRSHGRRSPPS